MQLSDRALQRRAKKYLLQSQLELFVPALPGFEDVTRSELRQLGLDSVGNHGGLALWGDLSTIYRLNLSLRSGNRVLMRVSDLPARNYPMLYNRARSIPWEVLLGRCQGVAVRVSSRRSRLRHKKHIASVLYDAISDRMRPLGLTPHLSADGELTVLARLDHDRCILSLDTTGEHLHKRGYRTGAVPAPIRETTAAAILLAAASHDFDLVVDPFCGSGTFLVEAEMIASNAPPGAHRSFAIEQTPLHSEGTHRHQLRLLSQASTDFRQRILGFDISQDAVELAKRSVLRAGASHVSLARTDALSLDFGKLGRRSEDRLIVANLPYGLRLGTASGARALVDQFALSMARTAVGWHYAIVTPRSIHLRQSGLLTTREIEFENGGVSVVASFGRVHG